MKQPQRIGRIILPMHWYRDEDNILAVSAIGLKAIETSANIYHHTVAITGISPFFEEVETGKIIKEYTLTCEFDDGRRIKSVTVEVVK